MCLFHLLIKILFPPYPVIVPIQDVPIMPFIMKWKFQRNIFTKKMNIYIYIYILQYLCVEKRNISQFVFIFTTITKHRNVVVNLEINFMFVLSWNIIFEVSRPFFLENKSPSSIIAWTRYGNKNKMGGLKAGFIGRSLDTLLASNFVLLSENRTQIFSIYYFDMSETFVSMRHLSLSVTYKG